MPVRSTRLPEPPSPGRKADWVARDLLRRIVSGDIPVGTILPREADLAAAYGVNRSVVREGIKLLEVHRLVRPVRRRGTEVLSPIASLSPEVLRAMLSPRPGRIDARVLKCLLEVRAHLDQQMTALAAQRRTRTNLREMDAILRELRTGLVSSERYAAAVGSFAQAVARATQNPIYEMLVAWHEMVATDLEAVFRVTRPATEPHLAGLALIVDLIRRREVEQVRTLVAAYHDWATPRLLAVAALSSGEPDVQLPRVARPGPKEKRS